EPGTKTGSQPGEQLVIAADSLGPPVAPPSENRPTTFPGASGRGAGRDGLLGGRRAGPVRTSSQPERAAHGRRIVTASAPAVAARGTTTVTGRYCPAMPHSANPAPWVNMIPAPARASARFRRPDGAVSMSRPSIPAVQALPSPATASSPTARIS